MGKGRIIKKSKLTILDVVAKILESDLPISTRNSVVHYYMLPKLGRTQAIIENPKIEVGGIERPTAEDIDIENNPRLKAEYRETERLMEMEKENEEEE